MFARRLPFRAQVSGVALESIKRGDVVTAARDYGDIYECMDCGGHPKTLVYEGFNVRDGHSCIGTGYAGWDADKGEDVTVYGDHGLIPESRRDRDDR